MKETAFGNPSARYWHAYCLRYFFREVWDKANLRDCLVEDVEIILTSLFPAVDTVGEEVCNGGDVADDAPAAVRRRCGEVMSLL